MDQVTQQIIGSFILIGSLAGMIYNLVSIRREEREGKLHVQQPNVSQEPIYIKKCSYIYPMETKKQAM